MKSGRFGNNGGVREVAEADRGLVQGDQRVVEGGHGVVEGDIGYLWIGVDQRGGENGPLVVHTVGMYSIPSQSKSEWNLTTRQALQIAICFPRTRSCSEPRPSLHKILPLISVK